MPDATLRTILWERMWPEQYKTKSPILSEINHLKKLAELFEFTPSQIHNIAERTILFTIANNHQEVTEKQLRPAIARELEKEGAVSADVNVTTTVSGAWETLEWVLVGTPNTANEVVFMFDFGNQVILIR